MVTEPSLHQIQVRTLAGVWEAKRRLLENGILECETILSLDKEEWPHRIQFYAPVNFDLDFLRPDILPPKDYEWSSHSG